jgi:hypothetical protein
MGFVNRKKFNPKKKKKGFVKRKKINQENI